MQTPNPALMPQPLPHQVLTSGPVHLPTSPRAAWSARTPRPGPAETCSQPVPILPAAAPLLQKRPQGLLPQAVSPSAPDPPRDWLRIREYNTTCGWQLSADLSAWPSLSNARASILKHPLPPASCPPPAPDGDTASADRVIGEHMVDKQTASLG